MIATLRRLWQRHRVAFPLFVLALIATVFFGARTVMFSAYWADPSHRSQMPQRWMTLRYVAHSWDVPVEPLVSAFGMHGPPRPRMTLGEIARALNMSDEEALAIAARAAAEAQRGAGQ